MLCDVLTSNGHPTDLIVSTLMGQGYDSRTGQAALARMNAIHGRFPISNADFLYVLSTFVFVPLDWIERFGRRPPSAQERLALFHFWREVGLRMGIQDIPDTLDELAAYHRDYAAAHYRYADSNRQVGEATRELFASWFPRLLRPLVRAAIPALLDDASRRAFGFAESPPWLARLVHWALRLRAHLLALLPVRPRPRLRTHLCHRSYPNGWTVTDLGPPWIAGKSAPTPPGASHDRPVRRQRAGEM